MIVSYQATSGRSAAALLFVKRWSKGPSTVKALHSLLYEGLFSVGLCAVSTVGAIGVLRFESLQMRK
jgi:hypothetical protein